MDKESKLEEALALFLALPEDKQKEALEKIRMIAEDEHKVIVS